ncbi:hypothetical protein CSA37_13005 [Candidatus Fermentibacteria bacterium]|nr:MAG: hypothetical protein CSA37_13005 [Candidatus Fermentibacteria bacterium]
MKILVPVLFLFAAVLHAGSLPYAYGGVVNSPDAYVLEHTEIEFGVAASAYSFENSAGNSDSDVKVTAYMNFGILSYGELGASYLADGGLVMNAKVSVLKEGIIVPAFTLGVQNGFGKKRVDCFSGPAASSDSSSGQWDEDGMYNYDHRQNWSVYGVASKDLSYIIEFPLTLNIGVGIGRFAGVIDTDGAMGIGSAIANGIFSSLVWEPDESLALAFEVDGRDMNLGCDYHINRNISVHLAWAEMEQLLAPTEGQNLQDVQQNTKVTIALSSRFGPIVGTGQMELEREQQRIERARRRLAELEARRRAAEAELQRLRDLLNERR